MPCRGSSPSLDKHGINKAGPVTLDELMQKAGALYMQGKKGHGGATDNQQALEPEAGMPWPKRCLVSSPMLKRVAW
jgi:hypothetical protein